MVVPRTGSVSMTGTPRTSVVSGHGFHQKTNQVYSKRCHPQVGKDANDAERPSCDLPGISQRFAFGASVNLDRRKPRVCSVSALKAYEV